MKLLTRDTDYALRALCVIAGGKGSASSTVELAEELGIPRPFLRKILQVLSKKGILKSYKGKSGGFILIKDSRKIFLTDLIKIFQGPFILNECSLKKHPCPNIRKCVLRKKITKIEGYVLKELSGITIDCLMKDGKRNQGG
jgi:Rrf2 family protein